MMRKNTHIYDVDFSSPYLYAAAPNGLFRSNDSGDTWESLILSASFFSLAFDGPDLFAGGHGHVYHSTNNGDSWKSNYVTDFMISSLAIMDTDLFAGSVTSGVFRSTDKGVTWAAVNTGMADTVVNCLAVKGTELFAGTIGGVYRSGTSGESWLAINNGLTSLDVQALAVSGSNLFAGTWQGGVFLTTDNGFSWNPVNTGLTVPDVLCFTVHLTDIFAGVWNGGVFLSTDNGGNWTPVNTGLEDNIVQTLPVIQSLLIEGTDLYAGNMGSGVWRRPLSEMTSTVLSERNEQPIGFSLAQNYPNPFNSATMIHFTLPKKYFVTLKIYDLQGRVVDTLVEGKRMKGSYHVPWETKDLPSGLYIYHLKTEDYSESRKLILQK